MKLIWIKNRNNNNNNISIDNSNNNYNKNNNENKRKKVIISIPTKTVRRTIVKVKSAIIIKIIKIATTTQGQ